MVAAVAESLGGGGAGPANQAARIMSGELEEEPSAETMVGPLSVQVKNPVDP